MTEAIKMTNKETADAVWVIRDRVTFMGELASGDLAVIHLDVPPGAGTPPHRHPSYEIFHVLEGSVTFGIFGDGPPKQVVANAGDVVTVPSHAPHNYSNQSGRPAKMSVVLQKEMIAFFRDLGRKEKPEQGPPTEAEIAEVMAACQRHNIKILGGP